MFSRANREFLAGGSGASGTEEPFTADANDLLPCDPTNSLQGLSTAWEEDGDDLRVRESPASDDNFTVSGSDLITNSI